MKRHDPKAVSASTKVDSLVQSVPSPYPMNRGAWTDLTDPQLLAQCAVDTYRASGPGGQKRNKTSSAVRLRHLPSGLLVIAEESRSQHENKAKALGRLRRELFLKLREPAPALPDQHPLLGEARNRAGRLEVGRKDPRFWPTVGLVLDVVEHCQSRISDAAKLLAITTGNLIDFLQTDAKVWEQVNHQRTRFGQKVLKNQ